MSLRYRLKKLRSLCLAIIIFNVLSITDAWAETIDILSRNPETTDELEHYLWLITPGNDSEVEMESLNIDTDSKQIKGKAKIVARQTIDLWFEVIPIQKTVWFDFAYDLQTGDIDGNFKIPILKGQFAGYEYDFGTIEISSDMIENILEGDFYAILDSLPNPVPNLVRRENSNQYAEIRKSYEDKYGTENVYFASEEFVDWASSEKIPEWTAAAIVTGGAALKPIMAQVVNKSREELNRIVNWLNNKGQAEALAIAEDILSGKRLDWPFLQLIWQPVTYESRIVFLNQSSLPPIRIAHGAFVIIWTRQNNAEVPVLPLPPGPSEPSLQPTCIVWPLQSQRSLVDNDLTNCTCKQLEISRNEIYARHGRIFARSDLQLFYQSQTWYRPDPNNPKGTEGQNDFEKNNAIFIRNAETNKNCPGIAPSPKTPSCPNWPLQSQRFLAKSDLTNCTCRQLEIMRNEIYARHGRIFARSDLQLFFQSQTWYRPDPNNPKGTQGQNDFENFNSLLIRDTERQTHCR